MPSRQVRLLPFFALALSAACSSGQPGTTADAGPMARVSTAAGASGPRVLPGHLVAAALRGVDRGRMDPEARLEGMTLVFSPTGTRAQRESLLAALQNPGSPLYHRWLTPAQYADRFGAGPADVARVARWLGEQGLEVEGASPPRTSLRFSGTVDALERAFRTEMHRYDVAGEPHFALAVEPSVPSELAGVVTGLRNVHDFHPAALSHPASPEHKTGSGYDLAPADWATIYGVTPLYGLGTPIDGTGQSIAVIGGSQLTPSDVQTFRSTFGLSAALPSETLVPGTGSPGPGGAGYQPEASLDVEWSGAIAKNATIDYVYVGSSPNYTVYDAALYAFEHAVAPVVTFSYGNCEGDYSGVDAITLGWEGDLAAMLGITFVVASGDGAAASCDARAATATHGLSVSLPASVPGSLAVGGTTLLPQPTSMYFDVAGNALSYIPEVAWNDTKAQGVIVGGGGGASRLFGKPFWQTGVTPNDGARDVPDVAFSASLSSLPYIIVSGGITQSFGGTSCAAPSFAGVLALLNQAIGAAQPGLGNVNPLLYALAASPVGKGVFHDVTTGGNLVPCMSGTPDCPKGPPSQLGYLAGPGYDECTGNGSVDAFNLVKAWSALAPTGTQLAVDAAGTTEGSPLTLTATIASTATANALGGDVIFYYATYDATGYPAAVAPLGTVPVTPTTTGGTQGATAVLDTFAPPGLTGTSTLVAFYAGDLHYLASWSPGATVMATSTLAVSPASSTVPTGGTLKLIATGGRAPVTWGFVQNDSGATIDKMTGIYVAGDAGGYRDIVLAVDLYGAQAIATIDVTPAPVDAGPPPRDASAPPLDGSDDHDGPADGAPADVGARPESDAGGAKAASSPGCACTHAGAAANRGRTGMAGLLLAFGAVAALRRRARQHRLRDRVRSSCRTCARAIRRGLRRAP